MISGLTAKIKRSTLNGLADCQENTFLFIDHVARQINLRLLILVMAVATVSFISAVLLTQGPQPIAGFRPEQIAYLGMPDTRLQMQFYTLLCVLLFSASLVIGLVRPGISRPFAPHKMTLTEHIPLPARPYAVVLFWVAVLLIYDPKLQDFLVALFVAYLMKEVLKGRFETSRIILAFVILCLGLFLLPLLFPPAIPDQQLWSMDIHWSAVIGDGLQEASGDAHRYEAFAAYGLLLTELIAFGQKFSAFRDLAGTQTLLIIVDIVFFGLLCFIITQRVGAKNARLIWASAILILLLFAGAISGALQNLTTPNQLPLRFILLPLTVIIAYYLGTLSVLWAALLVGAIAPLFAFYNFETGFYCLLALGYGLFIKGAKGGVWALLMAGMLTALTFVLSASFLILLFFDGPFPSVLQELLRLIQQKVASGTGGFAGLSYYFFAPFFLVMAHCMGLFASHLLAIRDRTPLSPIAFQGMVIVGLIIAIGPYEMNRYHLNKMWVPLLLYTLLMLPRLAGGPKQDRLVWSFILIVLVAPFLFGNPIRYVFKKEPYVAAIERVQKEITPCIDGLPASQALCHYAARKAEELRTLYERYPDIAWLSGLSLTMTRLTDNSPALAKKALFFYAHRDELRDNVINDIAVLKAPVFAFDKVETGNIAGIPEVVEDFQESLLQDAGYEVIENTEYWHIARLKGGEN